MASSGTESQKIGRGTASQKIGAVARISDTDSASMGDFRRWRASNALALAVQRVLSWLERTPNLVLGLCHRARRKVIRRPGRWRAANALALAVQRVLSWLERTPNLVLGLCHRARRKVIRRDDDSYLVNLSLIPLPHIRHGDDDSYLVYLSLILLLIFDMSAMALLPVLSVFLYSIVSNVKRRGYWQGCWGLEDYNRRAGTHSKGLRPLTSMQLEQDMGWGTAALQDLAQLAADRRSKATHVPGHCTAPNSDDLLFFLSYLQSYCTTLLPLASYLAILMHTYHLPLFLSYLAILMHTYHLPTKEILESAFKAQNGGGGILGTGLQVCPVDTDVIDFHVWYRGKFVKEIDYRTWRTWFMKVKQDVTIFSRLVIMFRERPKEEIEYRRSLSKKPNFLCRGISCFMAWLRNDSKYKVKLKVGKLYLKLFKDAQDTDVYLLLPGVAVNDSKYKVKLKEGKIYLKLFKDAQDTDVDLLLPGVAVNDSKYKVKLKEGKIYLKLFKDAQDTDVDLLLPGVAVNDSKYTVKLKEGKIYLKLFKDAQDTDVDLLLPGVTVKFSFFTPIATPFSPSFSPPSHPLPTPPRDSKYKVKLKEGKIYLKLFKDAQDTDVDLLLPGVTVKFSWLDYTIIFGAMAFAIGAAVYKASKGTLNFDTIAAIATALVLILMPVWGCVPIGCERV
eukprot:gene12418-15614_t